MKKRGYFLVGNWKMNPETLPEAKDLFKKIEKKSKNFNKIKVIVCPPTVYLASLKKTPKFIKKNKKNGELGGSYVVKINSSKKGEVHLGAQDVFYEKKGAYTGSISGNMVRNLGAEYTLVGHSERRKFGDTNEIVNKKAKAALESGLKVVLCFGEDERSDDGHYLEVLRNQILESCAGFSKEDFNRVILAYEPVWAIGAPEPMSARDLHETVLYVHRVLRENIKNIEIPYIIYGGAVDQNNAEYLINHGEVDGFIVGRQSLTVESFEGIMRGIIK